MFGDLTRKGETYMNVESKIKQTDPNMAEISIFHERDTQKHLDRQRQVNTGETHQSVGGEGGAGSVKQYKNPSK